MCTVKKILTQRCWRQNVIIDINGVMFKNALHTYVLTLITLLLIRITSNFQEMFIKASSLLLSTFKVNGCEGQSSDFDRLSFSIYYSIFGPRSLARTVAARSYKQ